MLKQIGCIIIFTTCLLLINSEVHSSQNYQAQCTQDILGNTCSQGWCQYYRTVDKQNPTHSVCIQQPYFKNNLFIVVYDFCQKDVFNKYCPSKCCKTTYEGYQQQKPLTAFCCNGGISTLCSAQETTWCNAQETLAIKNDFANYKNRKQKISNQQTTEVSTESKHLKEDSQEQLKQKNKNIKSLKEDSQESSKQDISYLLLSSAFSGVAFRSTVSIIIIIGICIKCLICKRATGQQPVILNQPSQNQIPSYSVENSKFQEVSSSKL